MKSVIQRIFKRNNILILVLISVALLSVVGVPQSFGITSDKIILAMLAILALDVIIERIGYLDRIETHLLDIESKVESKVSADELFKARKQLPSFDFLLEQGEIFWIGGKNLVGLLNNYGRQIQKAANEGKKFRFLIHNPNKSALIEIQSASSYTHSSVKTLEQKLQEAIFIFGDLLNNTPKDSIEIRLTDSLLTNAYLIIDSKKAYGHMIVEFYNYQISSGEQNSLYLKKQSEDRIFNYYLRRFESRWKKSETLNINVEN